MDSSILVLTSSVLSGYWNLQACLVAFKTSCQVYNFFRARLYEIVCGYEIKLGSVLRKLRIFKFENKVYRYHQMILFI